MGSDPKIRNILCQRLLQLRHENNLTQAELSGLSGIPQPVLSLYENGSSEAGEFPERFNRLSSRSHG